MLPTTSKPARAYRSTLQPSWNLQAALKCRSCKEGLTKISEPS
jgi:hypothetical protein